MTYAIPVNIALVDQTGHIRPEALARAAGALNEQVQADFAPVWNVRATVGVYQRTSPGHWQVRLVSRLDEPGALGYHTDMNGQPIAYVLGGRDDWPAIASHEILEMLADPFGMRMHQARLPQDVGIHWKDFGLKHESSRVSYLLEVCDPPEATTYEVGGVELSDFLLPAWYRTNPPTNGRYSHAGGCRKPREVARGGYVSFSVGPEWFQVFNWTGQLEIEHLGRFSDNDHISLRAWTDECSRKTKEKHDA